jgi:hypothetical protein
VVINNLFEENFGVEGLSAISVVLKSHDFTRNVNNKREKQQTV